MLDFNVEQVVLSLLRKYKYTKQFPKNESIPQLFFKKLDVRVRYKSSSRNKMLDFNVEQVVLSLLRKPQYTK